MIRDTICVVIVTFNRKKLLLRCLDAVRSQTITPDHILIIDNCSTDGTEHAVRLRTSLDSSINYIKLTENIGGSGGFYEGIVQAQNLETDLLWLMDDDAEPQPDALEQLIRQSRGEQEILGSAAFYRSNENERLCWPVTITTEGSHKHAGLIEDLNELPANISVASIPFLGFLIPLQLIGKLGLPERDYFLSGDDTEYCIRARKLGINIRLIKSSLINHPAPVYKMIRIGKSSTRILLLPPWKRYYDTRNRLLIARKHYGIKLLTHALPGTLVRLVYALLFQKQKLKQSRAFILGITDGILGRKGIRWQPGQ